MHVHCSMVLPERNPKRKAARIVIGLWLDEECFCGLDGGVHLVVARLGLAKLEVLWHTHIQLGTSKSRYIAKLPNLHPTLCMYT